MQSFSEIERFLPEVHENLAQTSANANIAVTGYDEYARTHQIVVPFPPVEREVYDKRDNHHNIEVV